MTQPLDDAPEDEALFEVDGDTAPGPDERDRDLMDGTWEQENPGGVKPPRDWRSIQIGVLILLILSAILPAFLYLAN